MSYAGQWGADSPAVLLFHTFFSQETHDFFTFPSPIANPPRNRLTGLGKYGKQPT